VALTALAIAPTAVFAQGTFPDKPITAVFAQGTFPDKPINYIIPFVPGGESDIAARLQGKVASKLTGKDLRHACRARSRPSSPARISWCRTRPGPAARWPGGN